MSYIEPMVPSTPISSKLSGPSADALVLSTVNAPFKKSIDAGNLAEGILSAGSTKWIVHVATFFTDVKPHLILAFAHAHGISDSVLLESYKAVKEHTGESNAELELSLVSLAEAA